MASVRPVKKLIERLSRWLVDDKHMRSGAVTTLKEELLTLKYLGSRSAFVREMAKSHAKKLPNSAVYLAAEEPGAYRVQAETRPPARHELQEALNLSGGCPAPAETDRAQGNRPTCRWKSLSAASSVIPLTRLTIRRSRCGPTATGRSYQRTVSAASDSVCPG